jgi:cytochrome c553
MGKVEKIEQQIKQLSEDEVAQLREWFAAFDAEAWDHQFEADVRAGKLDALGENALKAHAEGKTTKL